jgi:transposase
LTAALGWSGVGESLILEGAVTTAIFEQYVTHILAPSLSVGQIVLMDNLAAHKSVRVKEVIEAKGCQLLFLPGYSPDFSPIEEMFSKVKTVLRRIGARTREALQEALGDALHTVTAHDATSAGFGMQICFRMPRDNRLKNRSSLLKKSFVELCGTEKHRILLPYGANQHHFCQQKRNSASLKSQQFSFSTGCVRFLRSQTVSRGPSEKPAELLSRPGRHEHARMPDRLAKLMRKERALWD